MRYARKCLKNILVDVQCSSQERTHEYILRTRAPSSGQTEKMHYSIIFLSVYKYVYQYVFLDAMPLHLYVSTVID